MVRLEVNEMTTKNSLKFSAADWCFASRAGVGPEEYYAKLKELGFDAVEMVDPARRSAAKAAGLKILNLSGPGMAEGLNRLEHHKELLPKIKDCIEEAASEGIGAVIVFSGNRKGQFDCEGLLNCRTGLESVLPLAEAKGVEIHFEAFNIYDHVDYQADSSKYIFSLAKALKSPAFKALFDIYHMEMMGEVCAQVIPSAIAQIGHLHIAEAKTRTMPLAGGAIDYESIVKAALKAGYSRHWGMEFLPKGDVFAELKASKALFESYTK